MNQKNELSKPQILNMITDFMKENSGLSLPGLEPRNGRPGVKETTTKKNSAIQDKRLSTSPKGHNEKLTNYETVASYIQSIFVSRGF